MIVQARVRVLRVSGLGFRVLGFRVLGFRVKRGARKNTGSDSRIVRVRVRVLRV